VNRADSISLLRKPALSALLAAAACAHPGATHADGRWRPPGPRHYSVAELPSGELMGSDWTSSNPRRGFIDGDFYFSREDGALILLTTQLLTHGEMSYSAEQLVQYDAQMAVLEASSFANLPIDLRAKLRVSGPKLPFGEAAPGAAERLIGQDDPRLIVYAAVQKDRKDEAIVVIAAAKSGDPPLEEARQLVRRIQFDSK
jgi:hypothetical protein